MKIQENKTVYVCDFCKKKLFVMGAMERHEAFCFHNPENKPACHGCPALTEIKKEVYGDHPDGSEWSRTVRAFQCDVTKKELYPISAVRKGLIGKFPESFEDAEQMPLTCDLKPADIFQAQPNIH